MPRAPIACRIDRSRLALLAHLLPTAAVVGLLASVLPLLLWLSTALCLIVITVGAVRHHPRGELSAQALPGGEVQWRWLEAGVSVPQPVRLHCDYLGPWLIGLRLNGRRLWLWPDSCSSFDHRELRRFLIRH